MEQHQKKEEQKKVLAWASDEIKSMLEKLKCDLEKQEVEKNKKRLAHA